MLGESITQGLAVGSSFIEEVVSEDSSYKPKAERSGDINYIKLGQQHVQRPWG